MEVKTCSVEGCETKAVKDGLCGKHYKEQTGKSVKGLCSVPGCTSTRFKNGKCYRHLKGDAPMTAAGEGELLRSEKSEDQICKGKLARRGAAPSPEKALPPEDRSDGDYLVIDFSRFKTIKKDLEEQAEKAFRSSEMHALYLLNLALRAEQSNG